MDVGVDGCRCRKCKKSTADDRSSSSSSSWTEKSDNENESEAVPKDEQESAKNYAKGTTPLVYHFSDLQCTIGPVVRNKLKREVVSILDVRHCLIQPCIDQGFLNTMSAPRRAGSGQTGCKKGLMT